jgi:NADPH-dependent 2,4-dienoyl-CoA reductase/sulfur reductase-like enzyme
MAAINHMIYATDHSLFAAIERLYFFAKSCMKIGCCVCSKCEALVPQQPTRDWPYIPEFPGSEHALSSNEMFFLDKLPNKAVVVGGGYIAVEFAGILDGLRVETHLVYRGPKLLKSFDVEMGDKIMQG